MPLKIVISGLVGAGGYFGAKLAVTCNDGIFVARGARSRGDTDTRASGY